MNVLLYEGIKNSKNFFDFLLGILPDLKAIEYTEINIKSTNTERGGVHTGV